MKFSISFKYSNVTFKNKETKETITYDTKASEGNSFVFDNVDEDVVIGIVKGIKDKKASTVFSYDNFKTNFINTLARNKCKELYDKLDKGEWKVDDVAVSTITIKDLEFTKPTMNARENITVESANKEKTDHTIYVKWRWRSEDDFIDEGIKKLMVSDMSEEEVKSKVENFCQHNRKWRYVGEDYDEIYFEVFVDMIPGSKLEFLFDGTFRFGNVDWSSYEDDTLEDDEHVCEPLIKAMKESKKVVKESANNFKPGDIVDWFVPEDDEQYGKEFGGEVFHGGEVYKKQGDAYEVSFGEEGLFYPQGKDLEYHSEDLVESRKANESALPKQPVIFKKDRKMGEVLAFFPDTINDGSCNPGNIMCYAHNG